MVLSAIWMLRCVCLTVLCCTLTDPTGFFRLLLALISTEQTRVRASACTCIPPLSWPLLWPSYTYHMNGQYQPQHAIRHFRYLTTDLHTHVAIWTEWAGRCVGLCFLSFCKYLRLNSLLLSLTKHDKQKGKAVCVFHGLHSSTVKIDCVNTWISPKTRKYSPVYPLCWFREVHMNYTANVSVQLSSVIPRKLMYGSSLPNFGLMNRELT